MTTNRAATEIQKIDPGFLTQYVETDTSLAGMHEYRQIPSVKMIQAMTEQELKDKFGEGTAIVRPGDAVLCTRGDDSPMPMFDFVPLLFFVEFTKVSDLDDTQSPTVVERTCDPNHEIAIRAKDPERREEPYGEGGKFKFNYVANLIFIGYIYGEHPLSNVPVALAFRKGDYFAGKAFISAITIRKEMGPNGPFTPPLWSQVWRFKITTRKNNRGQAWFGLDHSPAPRNLILPEEAESFKAEHLTLKKFHEENRLQVQHESDEAAAEATTDEM